MSHELACSDAICQSRHSFREVLRAALSRVPLAAFSKPSLLLLLLLSMSACATNLASDPSLKKVTYYNSNYAAADEITGYLSKPEGDGPFPAVILLHGCAGLGFDRGGSDFRSLRRYQDALREAGFVSLIIDSWGSRGRSSAELYRESCPGINMNSKYGIRTGDLSGGIRYLKTLSFVGPRIGALGQSQGAETLIYAVEWRKSDVRENLLDAAIALYPPCIYRPKDVRIPLLVIMGDADNITPVERCENWLEMYKDEVGKRTDNGGNPVGILPELVTYSGVYHSFDLPLSGKQSTPIGAIAPNRRASEDTLRRVIDFFEKHLKGNSRAG